MEVVDLDRRFVEWASEEPPDPDFGRALGLNEPGLGWQELLKKRRVVILAEAGSGKSTELKRSAQIAAANHRYAFYASVEDVGGYGMEGALPLSDRERLAAWRKSQDEAWFFIDSVDEAKSAGIRFEKVAQKLAECIYAGEERAHIIFSTRVTDWEFRRDVEFLKQWLSIPAGIPPTSEEELLKVIRQEQLPEQDQPPSEQPFIAIMLPLNRDRVRHFAEHECVPNVHEFLDAIADSDLWHFARRPLDLQWLVQFWRELGRLGSLAEMIDRSITERLREPDPHRARSDQLASAAALDGVERLGAAMVLGRQASVKIPDSQVAFESESCLDLAEVLPDWSTELRTALHSRPVFDPATLGRVRFHNDNTGVIRGFLAARWLWRLRKGNLSTSALFNVLFAKSYGLEVIRPSLNETAAWLALWDNDVANEVVRRDPLLLLTAGDPASLPFAVRRNALTSLLHELTRKQSELPWYLDNDKLARFAQPDLGSVVASLWPKYRTNQEAVELLLRLVWLGALVDCSKLAFDAAFDVELSSTARAFAGRALLVIGDESSRRRYAELIIVERSTLPSSMIRDALRELFPTFVQVPELISILEAKNSTGAIEELDFDRLGPQLAERLDNSSDLEQLLRGLLAQSVIGSAEDTPPSKQREEYYPAVLAACLRLLKLNPMHIVPTVVVDALFFVCDHRNHSSENRTRVSAALAELHRTAPRRRLAFWHVVENLRRRSSGERKFDQLRELEASGFSCSLQAEDIEWLLADGLRRGNHDVHLVVDAALRIYRSLGNTPELLDEITKAVGSDALASRVYRELTEIQHPSEELLQLERESERIAQRNAKALAERDESWLKFISELRADRQRVENLATPPRAGVSSDLMDLWRLLSGAGSRSHYSINSVAPLERMAGQEVGEAVRVGLIAHWRNSTPLLRSQRTAEERNSYRYIDLMGIAGVSLEAASVKAWSSRLTKAEAERAASHATLEINGFPPWLSELAASWPLEVRTVLAGEIVAEISGTEVMHYNTLDKVAYAAADLPKLLTPTLLDALERLGQVPPKALPNVLRILVRGIGKEDLTRFRTLALERSQTISNLASSAQYLAAVFSLDPPTAACALSAKAVLLNPQKQTSLINHFLSASFGDSSSSLPIQTEVPAETLDQLVRLIFQTQEQAATRQPSNRRGGWTGDGGNPDWARNSVFNRFVKTPGLATYQALLRLQHDPLCPVPPARLQAFAEERAIRDSETAPWPPSDVVAFELTHETSPRTAADLQSLILHRLDDMQHDLIHGDFAQGSTLKALPDEADVQKWIADRLRLKQGHSFSVEREPHVVDEKEPDVRIRAKATDANVAIEIKVAESWTIRQLEEALEAQLCGRYLRSRSGRYGVLLLVHQQTRSKGWEDTTTGKYLSFGEILDRLSKRAAIIAGKSHDSPQPEVAAIDVSTC